MAGIFSKLKREPYPFCTALVAAAGSSTRMGENKMFMDVRGIPVLARTLQALQCSESVREIVIATREDSLPQVAELCNTYGIFKPVKVIVGGESRVESVLRAAMEANPQTRLFAVQDGARPFVTPEIVNATVKAAAKCAAAAPAIPVKDTVKVAEDRIVKETPDRSRLFAVQTPQVFDADLLKAALQSALKANDASVTDDCSAVERLGKEVYLTEGSEENIKITTPFDLIVAEAIVDKRSGSV
ncbi:MAG: 2-C-methyl-D-erythritol 4-phosphate cytidylyltransferase [Oscillospiraceae bacterium]|nr:2-C-methyl-D-erythritol 4-phosphate cytidylyltransferase [Oscillospiraceae bacterium]